jgi:hypothetical protein
MATASPCWRRKSPESVTPWTRSRPRANIVHHKAGPW